MNKEKFSSILANPDSIKQEDSLFLQELVAKYPFSQLTRILYLKNLQSKQDINYGSELKKTACFVTDRNKLYQIITPKNTKSENLNIETNNDNSFDSPFVYDITREYEIEKETKEVSLEIETLNKNISDFIINNEERNNINQTINSDNKFKNENHSFNEWLNLIDNKRNSNTEDIPARQIFKSNMEILSNFIKKQAEQKNKSEFYNPSKMAKKSLEEKDDIVSETLAKIYFDQADYNKAIQTYKKLMLIFPEKSIYFADKINQAKELKNKN